jgi:hypothetical protein
VKTVKIIKIYNCLNRLEYIERTLHRLDEHACNRELSKCEETRRGDLEKEGEEIAAELGVKFYHQGDPRGVAVKLYDKGTSRHDAPLCVCKR